MVMASDEEINAMMDIGADEMELDESGKQLIDLAKMTLVYEMMAISMDGTGSNIQIIAEKPALAGITAAQYVGLLQSQLPSLVEDVVLGELFTAELAGAAYEAFDYSMLSNGSELFGRYLVRKQGDRIVSIVLTSLDPAAFDAMLAGFSELPA